MIECLTVLSDINKKKLITAFLAVFCTFALYAEEPASQEQNAEPSVVQGVESNSSASPDSAVLTDRQKKLLNSLGIKYEEGESFETIMARAQEQKRQESQQSGMPAPQINPFESRMTPEMLEAQKQAAQKSREEYEARKAAIIERNQEKLATGDVTGLPAEAAAAVDAAPIKSDAQPEVTPTPAAQAADEPVKPVTLIPVDAAATSADSSDVHANKQITDANKELELTITLPEKVEITALIELVGKQLGLNYIYDPAEIKGEVMLKVHNGKIKVKDTYSLLESVLKFRGLVMTRRGNLVTIVPAAKAAEIDPMILEKGQEVRPGDVIVTSIFRLENISTDVAQNMLTSMNLTSNIVSLPETKSIIVTGYAYRMERIERMLAIVDVPGEKREFGFRRLEFTIASTVVSKIQALAENMGSVSVTVASNTQTAARPTAPQPIRRDASGRIIPQPSQPAQPGQPAPTTEVITSDSVKSGVYLDVDDRTNRILMVGTKKDIEEVSKLIDIFDVPKQDVREIKQYKMLYSDANEVINALVSLGIIQEEYSQSRNSYSRGSMTSQMQRQPVVQGQNPAAAAQSGTTEDFMSVDDAPQVVLLSSSNSLLVNATKEQHEKIVSIIEFIDNQPEEDQSPVKVYPLENQSVDKIQDTLTNVVEQVAKEKAEAEQGGTGGVSDTAGKVQKTTIGKNIPNVIIAADEGTNSIVVFASRKDQEWIESLIKDLDKKRPQVLIDVTLVEITKKDKFEFSLKTEAQNSTTYTGRGDLEANWDTQTMTGYFTDKYIDLILTTIKTKNYGRVMARPKLLVNDNEEGNIETKRTTYKKKETTTYINTGNEATTPEKSYEYIDYSSNITLTITPHISEGDMLRLDIAVNRTDFDYSTSSDIDERPYDQVSSDVTTVVTVPDGSTIILGGMATILQGKGGNKIPILGDLPIIGGLFRSISNKDEQTKLYVFVKAYILRPDIEGGLPALEEQSKINRDSFEEGEKEFQQYQDWPGFDAEPIKPDKVLDMK